MALDRIEQLLEKYFQGETSIVEENELKLYFSSQDVAQHLEHYKSLFNYYSNQNQQFNKVVQLKPKKANYFLWVSVAASVVVLIGISLFMFNKNQNVSGKYGTYDDPEQALVETQKALDLISLNVNKGIESVSYIDEYDKAKNRIFIK